MTHKAHYCVVTGIARIELIGEFRTGLKEAHHVLVPRDVLTKVILRHPASACLREIRNEMSSLGDPRSSEPDARLPDSSASLLQFSTRRIPWLCGVIFVLINLGAGALPASAARLFEAALCRRYYESHESDHFSPGSEIPERYCKIQDIQIAVTSTISIITVATRLAGKYTQPYV